MFLCIRVLIHTPVFDKNGHIFLPKLGPFCGKIWAIFCQNLVIFLAKFVHFLENAGPQCGPILGKRWVHFCQKMGHVLGL